MELYITVIRKMLACVRHEVYLQCEKQFNDPANRKSSLTEQEAEELLSKIQETKQEEFRKKILAQNGIVLPDNVPPKRIMQKAYLTFSTMRVSGLPNNKPWMSRVQHEHQIHAKIFDKITRGEKVEGIEENPLEGKDIDNYEAMLVPGTLFKRKNDKGEEEVSLQPDEKSLNEADALLKRHKTKKAAASLEATVEVAPVVAETQPAELAESQLEEQKQEEEV